MNLLLDTCEFLFLLTEDEKLSSVRRQAIENPENTVFLSSISVSEIALKYSIGKLKLPESPQSYIPRNRVRHRIAELPLTESAALSIAQLPFHHRDPFDRLLIAQALTHRLTLVTSDPLIQHYELSLL